VSRQFRVELCANWNDFISIRNANEHDWVSTPFQTGRWIESWINTIGAEQHVQALPIIVYKVDTNCPVILLPMVLNSAEELLKIEPADLGLSDYNAPIITRNLALSVKEFQIIWQAIKALFPPHDMLLITKIPEKIQDESNLFYSLKTADKSPLNGNILHIKTPWHDYHWGLERTFRKELERSWRVFEKHPEARFENITDTNQATQILYQLEMQQAARMNEVGEEYLLDRPEIANFYRDLVRQGISSQNVRLTALMVDDEIVAALLGVTNNTSFSMVRLSTGDKKWRNCSPGRLLIYKTMEFMHAQGFATFDYTIGDYAYKRRMGAEFVPLCNIVEAGNLRHISSTLILRLRFRLQLSPTWRRYKQWQKSRERNIKL
jgi:CelD/BcsL family acetyltransferase involved in cellulose biosynthesis